MLALALAFNLPDPQPPANVEPAQDARQAPLYLVLRNDEIEADAT